MSPLSDGLPIHIYKNRSTGNLPAESTKSMEGTRIRFSIDAGNPSEHDPMGRSPVMQEHEHGLGVSGLRRIRQQPQSRPPTLPPSPEASFTSPSRSSSLTLNFPNPRTFTPGGPASPTLNFSEDLTRFPSESLHSFSFAHQSEDVLHNRQNILKRSIDFMRDRLGWAANNPGLVNAQAKVSGDVEIQSMMELLARANVLGPEKDREKGITFHGPLTGPANVEGKNVFEKSFLPRSESPDQLEPSSSSPVEVLEGRNGQSGQTFLPNSKVPSENMRSEHDRLSSLIAGELPTTSKAPASYATRPGMKRTYTDISSLSLQSKLMEALAKPYFPGDWEHEHHLLAPNIIPSLGKAVNGSSYAPSTAHGHANRWAPAAQVIFTTEAKAPWTILAANDLACLVFGVTKAEIRKLGILEVVREDRRDWLEEKLRAPGSEAAIKARQNKSGRSSPYSTTSMPMGGGITAKLLSKPPARSMAGRRAMTDDGSGSSYGNKNNVRGGPNHPSNKSRGVLLCGDIIGIQKRNGATGSASVWVKEKRGGLIWVLEEIVEDIAELTVDGAGKVINATGSTSMIWGHNKAPERVDIRKLIPCLPIIEGRSRQEVDYDKIKELEHFTARHSDGYNIPISIVARPALGELRVSSFPHIAGIMVLSSSNLTITSSNSVFSAALFGLQNPNGLSVNQLLPQFDKILKLMIEEEQIRLVDGMVIPEHSFRRARALLALREGSPDAAAIFLRQTGLVARHRDGADINVDVQLRVVKSECLTSEEPVIIEQNEDETSIEGSMSTPAAEVVYALWITYSRHLHSIVRPGDPVSPLISRPGTPPRQPSPGQSVNIIAPEQIDSEDANDNSKMSLLTQQIQEAASEPISAKPHAQPPIEIKPSPSVQEALPKKKTINDFIILQEMGQGAYGQVKLARYKKTSSKVVLKYVTKKRILVDTWARGQSSPCSYSHATLLNHDRRPPPWHRPPRNSRPRLCPARWAQTPQHRRND